VPLLARTPATPTCAKLMVDNQSAKRKAPSVEASDGYFESYAGLGIHEEMLRCRRTDAYLRAIRSAGLAGKTVLDVGCGTGVLAIACARAGARKVYAVEASAVAECARAVVSASGLTGSVEVIRGKVEEVELPERVDVIVSEWMGCFLLYESMLDSVLRARDRWLKPGGSMLPRRAQMWLAPFRDEEAAEEQKAFWADVHGIDMSCLAPIARAELARRPEVELLLAQNVISSPSCVLDIGDLASCDLSDCQSLCASFDLSSHVRAELHGFVGYFAVELVPGQWLSTAPDAEPTHWRHVLFHCELPLPVQQDERIRGRLTMTQATQNPRCWDVVISFGVSGGGEERTQRYELDVRC